MEAAQPYPYLWRRAAVVASAIAAVELVALLAALVALFGVPFLHHVQRATLAHEIAATQPKAYRQPPAGAARLTRAETSVLVLNGNGEPNAASAAAARIRAHGYTIGDVGNAPRSDYATTLVMYRPGYRAEGERLAHDLNARAAQPLDGITRDRLMGAQVAVILGK